MSEEGEGLGHRAAGMAARAAVAGTGILSFKVLLPLVLVVLLGLGSALLLVAPVIFRGATDAGSSGNLRCVAGGHGSVPETDPDIEKEQIKNAKLIDEAAQKLGLSGEATRIAIITAYGESTLINIGHGDEGQGVTNSDGSATTSKGLFQQQTSQGWGTVEQVMDPIYAATSFFTGPKHDRKAGLVAVPGWQDLEPTQAIHLVQKNRDSNHYAKFYGPADAIIEKADLDTSRAATAEENTEDGEGPAAESNTNECSLGGSTQLKDGEGQDDYPWSQDEIPGPGVYTEDGAGFYLGECTSFAMWRINRDAGASQDVSSWRYTNTKGGAKLGNGFEWKAAWEARGWEVSSEPVAGAVAWWGANGGEGIGEYGHVAYVESVTDDGQVVIEEYNNSFLSPPGHKYSKRKPMPAENVNAYLIPPHISQ